jgi:hypothetical protein
LLILGIDLAVQLALTLILGLTWEVSAQTTAASVALLYAFMFRCALYALLTDAARGPRRWQHFLFLFFTQSLICCLGPFLAVILVCVLLCDWVERASFSWLHWVGAAVCFWQLLFGTLLYPGGIWAELFRDY